jgi:hypothetical protein
MNGSIAVEVSGLVDPRIVAAWAQDAVMEHASIASFARFTLELLAVGAPPKLLLASQQAGRDEVQHALKCFTIASRLGGTKIGPSPLDVSGVDAARDLTAIVEATVMEGCIVETLSAVYARERAHGARDPEMRAALLKIADDEGQHAELAWQFAAWGIERGGAPVRDAARRVFEEAEVKRGSGFNPLLTGVPPALVRAYGLLDEETSTKVTMWGMLEVIAPRARQLLRPRA